MLTVGPFNDRPDYRRNHCHTLAVELVAEHGKDWVDAQERVRRPMITASARARP